MMINLDVRIWIFIAFGLNLSHGERTLCPIGYIYENGSCGPCPAGYFGKACSRKCDGNNYGMKCLNKCFCSIDEKCHHAFGCINIQQSSTEEVSESTVKICTRRITSTTAKPEANNLALSQREIIVYSIGAGAFVFVILLCTVCQCRYKQIYVKFKRYKTSYRKNRNTSEIALPNIPLQEIEGTYEVIDDSNIIDNVGVIMEGNNTISDINENNCQSKSNSYLTPCQPSDEDLKTNNVIDNKTDLAGLLDGNHQTTSDLESTSSTSDVQNYRSSYLNPYQPIVHSVDIHEYLSIHDSGSSGSIKFFSLR